MCLKKILGFIYVNYLPCVLREKKMKMKMKLYSWVEMLKVYALKWKLVLWKHRRNFEINWMWCMVPCIHGEKLGVGSAN